MPLNAPLTLEQFAERMAALGAGTKIALAVSGGRDSMALARLAADYAGQRGGVSLIALIVDHGLRAEAAEEAARAKAWCEAAGITTEILTWRGDKPRTGIQAAARRARYRLLAARAEELGFPVLMTAHSADDQAETILMRMGRGAGGTGLAGMDDDLLIAAGAAAPVRLVRPLLPFTRGELTATVKAYDQPYVDDPSNENDAYERVRVRRFLREGGDGIVECAALLDTAAQMRELRQAQHKTEQRLFTALGGCFIRSGGAVMKTPLIKQAARERAGDLSGLIARLIRAIGAGEHAPSRDQALVHLEQCLETGASALGGALMKNSKGEFWVMREPAALTGRAGVAPMAAISLAPGETALWDNRYILRAGAAIKIRPLGQADKAAHAATSRVFDGPKEALAAIPAIYEQNRLIGAPGFLSAPDAHWSAKLLISERFSGRTIRF